MSFEKALKEPRRGRIHDLATQESADTDDEGIYFDVDRELSKEDWKHLVECLDANRPHSRLWFWGTARNLVILKPKEKYTFLHTPDDFTFDQFVSPMGFIERYKGTTQLSEFDLARLLQLISVDKRYGIAVENLVTQDIISHATGVMRMVAHYDVFTWLAAAVYMVDRDRALRELPIGDTYWNDLKKIADELIMEGSNSDGILDYVDFVTNLRFIIPERWHELGVEKHWKLLKKELDILRRQGDWTNVARVAAGMKVIAAKEVNVTDHGLELIMPEKQTHREKISKRPTRQQF